MNAEMDFQEYLRKINTLTSMKNSLYDLASQRYREGDTKRQHEIYAQIDKIDKELNELENPQARIATDDELTIKFD